MGGHLSVLAKHIEAAYDPAETTADVEELEAWTAANAGKMTKKDKEIINEIIPDVNRLYGTEIPLIS